MCLEEPCTRISDTGFHWAPPDVILGWANEETLDHYPCLSKEICLFQRGEAPERGRIPSAFSERLRPTS
jgi:hypothetical protein